MASMNHKSDRFSTLPESVLVHILSFLPTEDAVRTMLVKKSFGSLWTMLSSLDLDDQGFYFTVELVVGDDGIEKYVAEDLPFFIFVRNVLMGHKRPQIDKFRVGMSTLFCDIESLNLGLEHEIDSWISFALRKQVIVLEFSGGLIEPCCDLYKWPNEFVSNSLVEMRLEAVNLNSLTRVHLTSLKILRLIFVEVNDGALAEIIQRCSSLKELEIDSCGDLYSLSIDASSSIEKLIVDMSIFNDGFLLQINSLNLKFFNFTGIVNSVNFVNLSSVVDVTFNLKSLRSVFNESQEFITALNALAHAERITFSCEFVTVLFYCMLKDGPQISTYWKHATFGIRLTEKHVRGLSCVLRNSPHLEELVLDIARWQSDFAELIGAQLDDDPLLDREECWRSLKSVTIHNIAYSSYEVLVSLTELLLKKAIVLSELVFYYKGKHQVAELECNLTSDQVAQFSKKLPTLPKGSQHVNIRCIR